MRSNCQLVCSRSRCVKSNDARSNGHSTGGLFMLLRLSEQCRPQTQIRRLDVHCANALPKPCSVKRLSRREYRAFSGVDSPENSVCGQLPSCSSPASSRSMKILLLNVAVRTARFQWLLFALMLSAALFACGRASAQSPSATPTGAATAHDVANFSELAAASDATAAPAPPGALRKNKPALPRLSYKPSHGTSKPLRRTQTVSATDSASSSTLRTMSLASASLVATSSFSASAFSPTSSPPASASFLGLFGD